MSKLVNITGQRFGRLIVLEKAANHTKNVMWLCQCDCGNKNIVFAFSLKNGNTKSCGCLRDEIATTHGFSKHSMFAIWRNMKSRCYDSFDKAYYRYGGRGIIICDRWLNSFEVFVSDMGRRPSKNHSVERKNNNGNYDPGNCKWATNKEQCRNTRSNRMIEYNGESKCISEWAEILDIPRRTLHNRLFRLGWPIDRALTTSRIR